nr:hypothetical protein Q903MT_gene3556 [Picea sitchensis]
MNKCWVSFCFRTSSAMPPSPDSANASYHSYRQSAGRGLGQAADILSNDSLGISIKADGYLSSPLARRTNISKVT